MDTVTIHYHKSVTPIAFAKEHGQSDITLHESQIDARVYRLYGQSPDEIKIVEGES
jgi:hypothetical protein